MIEKPNLTEKEIVANYQEFLAFITSTFTGERQEKLLHMYSEKELGQELAVAPASMNEQWHNAFPGGYILHIMNVVKTSFGVKKLYETMGGIIDFTQEEQIFSALHHDLGKLGGPDGSYYVPQTNDWKEKQGELYQMNPNIQYMPVTDRALYNLQYYGIKTTWKEAISIKLSDGMYDESNKKYLVQFKPEMFLKSCLPRIIHISDYMSSCFERDKLKDSN